MSEDEDEEDKQDDDEKVFAQYKEIMEQRDKLVELIKNYEGSKSDVAFQCCFELVIWGGGTHFESLGLITELQHAYRNASYEAINDCEDEEDDCEHCNDKDCEECNSNESNKKSFLN